MLNHLRSLVKKKEWQYCLNILYLDMFWFSPIKIAVSTSKYVFSILLLWSKTGRVNRWILRKVLWGQSCLCGVVGNCSNNSTQNGRAALQRCQRYVCITQRDLLYHTPRFWHRKFKNCKCESGLKRLLHVRFRAHYWSGHFWARSETPVKPWRSGTCC